MYTATDEMLTISSLLIGTPACSPPFVFLTFSRWPARTIMYQHLPKSRMAPQEKNQKKRKSIRRQEKVNLRRRPGTTRTPAETKQQQKAKDPEELEHTSPLLTSSNPHFGSWSPLSSHISSSTEPPHQSHPSKRSLPLHLSLPPYPP